MDVQPGRAAVAVVRSASNFGMLSVIVPALNEEATVRRLLEPLQEGRGQRWELILVDGGSQDATLREAEPLVDILLEAPAGRARQMNAGAARAQGDVLWFLHADSVVESGHCEAILRAIDSRDLLWGRFDVTLSGHHKMLRVVEYMMNLRSRLSGIATGDQGIFVRRDLFERVHGYSEIPLMEDVQLSGKLRRHGRPCTLHKRLVTSSRRWETRGVIRTVLLMWCLRLAYALGVDPALLAKHYR